jgi:membrane protease YdiL (CAAX protease family)
LLAGAAYLISRIIRMDVGIIGQNLSFITPIIIFSILLGSTTEEIGWRSFLQTTLEKKYSVLLSSIILGIIWTLWHIERYFVGIVFMGIFMIITISFSIIIAMILKDTKNNIIVSTLTHSSFNLSFMIFFANSFTETKIMILVAIILTVGAIISILTNRDYFIKNKSQKT